MLVVTSVNLTAKNPIETGNNVKTTKLFTILNAVCEANNVNIYDVKDKRRFRELITARREYCYLACKLTQLTERNPFGNSLAKIGAEINIDHATVMYHKRIITNWLGIPGYGLREKFKLIEKQLKI